MMKKIVITQDLGLTNNQKKLLSSLGEVHFFDDTPKSQIDRLNRTKGADIIYSEEIYMHENLYNIKNCFLTFPFSGFLKYIDINILKSNKVITSSAKGGNKFSVAERNITALLYLTRNIKNIKLSKQQLDWGFLSSIDGCRGLSVLILGKGNIGFATGNICKSLGMQVDYYLRGDNISAKIQGKDVIINCLTLNDTTKGLIDKKTLENFQGYYITCTRDEIHIIDDIIELINNGKIIGYGNDCASIAGGDASSDYYNNILKQLTDFNIFITPHIAWTNKNAIEYSNDICIQNIKAYIDGSPINLIY